MTWYHSSSCGYLLIVNLLTFQLCLRLLIVVLLLNLLLRLFLNKTLMLDFVHLRRAHIVKVLKHFDGLMLWCAHNLGKLLNKLRCLGVGRVSKLVRFFKKIVVPFKTENILFKLRM